MKNILRYNIIIFVYSALFIFIELFSLLFVGCKPFLSNPWYTVVLLSFIITLLFFIKNKTAKVIVCGVLLLIQIVFSVGFAYLYSQNGISFDWSVFSQRFDALGTAEQFTANTAHVIALAVALILFILASIYYLRQKTQIKSVKKKYTIGVAITTAVLLLVTALTPLAAAFSEKNQSYTQKLYNNANRYQEVGIFANTIYELARGGTATNVNFKNTNGIEDFIYSDTILKSDYNGISKDNNLILILAESLEWFPLLTLNSNIANTLYPNLMRMYNGGISMSNFYAREKTDSAEMLMLLGSNPTGKHIAYDFYDNEYPYALPNLFKGDSGDTQVMSFHQNRGEFYNRDKVHQSLGFERLVDIKELEEMGVENSWEVGGWGKGERTLDSDTIEKAKDLMFLQDRRFFSFYISFTMHGFYKQRQNLQQKGYYDVLDSLNVYPTGSENENNIRTYAAAMMDFDIALGIMLQDLLNKGVLDNTTIMIVSDHNAYYNKLSAYAKGITDKYNSELYKIPCIIYDTKVTQAYIAKTGKNTVDKFTTTADIVPTMLDILGINGYQNLYLGNSVFVDGISSVVFSRSYSIFFNNKLSCFSIKDLLYKSSDYTLQDKTDFIKSAETLLIRLQYIDKIFYSNYFSKEIYKYEK